MHENPRATEEEQELSQTERMHDEEKQRGAHVPDEVANEDDGEEDKE
jgi:hypothetical protein